MLTHSELKKGAKIIIDGEPYEILEARPLKMAQRRVVIQSRIRNLVAGNVFSRNFHQGDIFQEAELSKIEAKFLFSKEERKQGSAEGRFLYSHQYRYFFCEKDNPGKRFDLNSEQIGSGAQFLKPGQIIDGIIFQGKIINIYLPIKIQLKITEAPPGVKGDRSQPGTKQVTLETGTKINTPLFIEEGDVIEVNTDSGEYVRRIE